VFSRGKSASVRVGKNSKSTAASGRLILGFGVKATSHSRNNLSASEAKIQESDNNEKRTDSFRVFCFEIGAFSEK
jgi:hypothetical protein